VAGITLILGIDRVLNEVRAIVNMIGNAVATIVVARWEGAFDARAAREFLAAPPQDVLRDEPQTQTGETEGGAPPAFAREHSN